MVAGADCRGREQRQRGAQTGVSSDGGREGGGNPFLFSAISVPYPVLDTTAASCHLLHPEKAAVISH